MKQYDELYWNIMPGVRGLSGVGSGVQSSFQSFVYCQRYAADMI